MIEEIIEFKAHDPEWAKTFEQKSAFLKVELGEHIATFHHVGSTAISSIDAKPIIDITVESSEYPPSALVVRTLERIGFLSHGNGGVAGRSWFSKGVQRVTNLHWCPINGAVVQSQLCFRDALRADKTLANEYEALKKKTFYGKHIDSAEYAAAKDNFIETVLFLWPLMAGNRRSRPFNLPQF